MYTYFMIMLEQNYIYDYFMVLDAVYWEKKTPRMHVYIAFACVNFKFELVLKRALLKLSYPPSSAKLIIILFKIKPTLEYKFILVFPER